MDNKTINQANQNQTINTTTVLVDKTKFDDFKRKFFMLSENLDEVYNFVVRNLSMADVLSEALDSFNREEAVLVYDFTVSESVKAILDYADKAFSLLLDIQDEMYTMNQELNENGGVMS